VKIAVAGASGFVGREVIRRLVARHQVVGLSRRAGVETAELSWASCDLFSLLQVERALEGCDVGLYLAHSMMPPNRLTQGSFADLDLIIADNFARAARLRGLRRIIYLGGIIPQGDLSEHLASRLEVEKVLQASGIPVIALRAGLIVGPGGSSFPILERLVKRLPVLVCPKWTAHSCQPIAVSDAADVLAAVVDDETLPARAYDLAGPDVLTYREMLTAVARHLGLRRLFLPVPAVSPALSRLWVSSVTGVSRRLVYPLVESLKADMIARGPLLTERYGLRAKTFTEALAEAMDQPAALSEQRPPRPRPSHTAAAVTSVQRLRPASPMRIADVVQEFTRWLPAFMRPIVSVRRSSDGSLSFRSGSIELLSLEYSEERSTPTRQLYYIAGGRLLRKVPGEARGRLEFRAVPGGSEVIAAILDYRPSLPWWIYRQTQARVHALVMLAFGLHLRLQGRARPRADQPLIGPT